MLYHGYWCYWRLCSIEIIECNNKPLPNQYSGHLDERITLATNAPLSSSIIHISHVYRYRTGPETWGRVSPGWPAWTWSLDSALLNTSTTQTFLRKRVYCWLDERAWIMLPLQAMGIWVHSFLGARLDIIVRLYILVRIRWGICCSMRSWRRLVVWTSL